MTLGNMRANDVRSLMIYCSACPRIVVFNVDAYPESAPVPAFGPRMVCTGCGMIGADARPNWRGALQSRPCNAGALTPLSYCSWQNDPARLESRARAGSNPRSGGCRR